MILLPAALMAGELRSIDIEKQNGTVRILLKGKDLQRYQTLILKKPARFVLDLLETGYRVDKKPVEFSVQTGAVLRVRSSQYRLTPVPITRVVLDLSHLVRPTVSRTDEGLVVVVPAGGGPVSGGVQKAPSPSPAPPSQPASSPPSAVSRPRPGADTLMKKVQELKRPPRIRIHHIGRDPFEPIGAEEDTLLNPEKAKLMGIVRGPDGAYALLTDGKQNYVLREGDRVQRGQVAKIGEDYVIFSVYEYGVAVPVRVDLETEKKP
ncbi:MAG: AMIN domain-containing protein [Candidatus Hydrothermae bacterium]|nr:AMIN domain-containing protein [Candidatus Hydrothermae bacterium]